MSIFSGTVEKGVMKFVKAKIAEAQKAHDSVVSQLEEQHDADIETAHARLEQGINDSVQHHINSIIGKII